MTETPFFVVGCARSGTTLLRTMLNQHSKIAIPVEALFMIDYLRAESHLSLPQLRQLILGEFELREWELQVTANDLNDCENVVAIFDRLHKLYVNQNGKQIWGQKTPRFIRHSNLLKKHYPQAKFIHLIRDPRAVANSLRQSNIHRSNIYFGAKRWLKDVGFGRRIQQDYPDSLLEIYYEKLVQNPEATLQTVCDFLDVEFDEQMLAYHEQEYTEYNHYHANVHRRLKQPLMHSRIDAWRETLSQQESTLVEQVCMPLMSQLGYEPEHQGLPTSNSYIHRLKWQRRTIGIPRQILQYFNGRSYHLFYSLWRKYRLGLLLQDVSQVNY